MRTKASITRLNNLYNYVTEYLYTKYDIDRFNSENNRNKKFVDVVKRKLFICSKALRLYEQGLITETECSLAMLEQAQVKL